MYHVLDLKSLLYNNKSMIPRSNSVLLVKMSKMGIRVKRAGGVKNCLTKSYMADKIREAKGFYY